MITLETTEFLDMTTEVTTPHELEVSARESISALAQIVDATEPTDATLQASIKQTFDALTADQPSYFSRYIKTDTDGQQTPVVYETFAPVTVATNQAGERLQAIARRSAGAVGSHAIRFVVAGPKNIPLGADVIGKAQDARPEIVIHTGADQKPARSSLELMYASLQYVLSNRLSSDHV